MPSSIFRNLSDEELYKRLRNDEEAFNELYLRHRQNIYKFVNKYTGKPELAEDIVQIVFCDLLNNKLAFDPAKGSLKNYLLGVAYKKVCKEKKRGLREFLFGDSNQEGVVDLQQDPIQFQIMSEIYSPFVSKLLLQLKEEYRVVLLLAYQEELSYEEIAQVLGSKVSTVKPQLFRARASFKELFMSAQNQKAGE